jgi:hypothetical protein
MTIINVYEEWIGQTKWCPVTHAAINHEMYQMNYVNFDTDDCTKQSYVVQKIHHRQKSKGKKL